jgi:DNA mismatch repair protein MSH2
VAILAQLGSFVPCASATLCVVDQVLSRFGSSDNQSAGVSTFMAEMLDAASILRTATSDSLVSALSLSLSRWAVERLEFGSFITALS